MSNDTKLPRVVIQPQAEAIKLALAPACEKIDIAGSLRRQKPLVGDIEIVCMPKLSLDMFGMPTSKLGTELDDVLARLIRDKVLSPLDKNGPRFKNFVVCSVGVKLDLFICLPPAQWGVIFTIRTGSAEFTKRMVTRRNEGGLLPSYLKVSEGQLLDGKNSLPVPTEEDFFKLAEIEWIAPEGRS